MQPHIRAAIEALLKIDTTVTVDERKRILAQEGHERPPLDRILPHSEVAKLLGVGQRSLTNYIRRGWLRPFRPQGQPRALGFLESDVRTFLAAGDSNTVNSTVA